MSQISLTIGDATNGDYWFVTDTTSPDDMINSAVEAFLLQEFESFDVKNLVIKDIEIKVKANYKGELE